MYKSFVSFTCWFVFLFSPATVIGSRPYCADCQQEISKPYSNPALIYGTSFPEFFKQLYRLGKFDDMLSFTSSKSIHEFGKEKILQFYQTMDWGYEIKLKSINQKKDFYTLNCIATIQNTARTGRMQIVIENDSCKLMLNKSNFMNGIDGLKQIH